jgi:hypothetical protein
LDRLGKQMRGAAGVSFLLCVLTRLDSRSHPRQFWTRFFLGVPLGFAADRYFTHKWETAAHEGTHAVLLWALTGEWPGAVSLVSKEDTYAYAAAPAWYLPRNRYLLVGLVPLVGLSLLLLVLARLVPAPLLGWLLATLMRNARGSQADLYVAWELIRRPAVCYLNDTGEVFTFWEPSA